MPRLFRRLCSLHLHLPHPPSLRLPVPPGQLVDRLIRNGDISPEHRLRIIMLYALRYQRQDNNLETTASAHAC